MRGFDLVKNGQADAMVSAGHSGATMTAAIRKLGRLEGVSRPGIASLFPTRKTPVMLMDIGANVDCRPQHLFQFAVMASSCYALLQNKKKSSCRAAQYRFRAGERKRLDQGNP